MSGLDPAFMMVIASCIGIGQITTALKRQCHATRLHLVEGKRYVDCPHGHGIPEPTPSAQTTLTVVEGRFYHLGAWFWVPF
jgi:hypothetical protein